MSASLRPYLFVTAFLLDDKSGRKTGERGGTRIASKPQRNSEIALVDIQCRCRPLSFVEPGGVPVAQEYQNSADYTPLGRKLTVRWKLRTRPTNQACPFNHLTLLSSHVYGRESNHVAKDRHVIGPTCT